ncbi:MAG: NUDIX domain-containing protein [Cytophagales bacterium]|nr:MAG: NUDIX domain-containing protein [Cytophagales bacterium]
MTNPQIPYHNETKFLLAVDCIVLGFDGVKLFALLVKRKFKPMQNKWSLMGGFLKEDENLNEAASRIIDDLTGLKDLYLEQLNTYSDIYRDTASRVVSVAYFALLNTKNFPLPISKEYLSEWFEIGNVPKLIFDHNHMLEDTIKSIREKILKYPIAFSLLPEKFSMSQLQNLYEAILEQSLDKRNFRKQIISSNIISKTIYKEKTSSKKGAYLYSFNKN